MWIELQDLHPVRELNVGAGAGADAAVIVFRVQLSTFRQPDSALAGQNQPKLRLPAARLVFEHVKPLTFISNKRSKTMASRALESVQTGTVLRVAQTQTYQRQPHQPRFGMMACSGLVSAHRAVLEELVCNVLAWARVVAVAEHVD